MSFDLILPFFPEELRELLLDPSISDLMINGTNGVFADRNGIVEQIALLQPFTKERLQAAIERVARILGQDLTTQNPILNTRLPDGSRVAVVGSPSSISGPTFTVRKFNRWFTSDELVASGSLPVNVRDTVVRLIEGRKGERRHDLPSFPGQHHCGAAHRKNFRHSTPQRVVYRSYQGSCWNLDTESSAYS